MEQKKGKRPPPIYVVSGGKGLAGNNMVQSLLIQYPNNNVPVIIVPDVLTEEHLEKVVLQAKATSGLIAHTMVNPALRVKLNELGRLHEVETIDFMGELMAFMNKHVDIVPLQHPGLYREINAEYFDRIDAIEYTLNHDDGLGAERLHQAEIILTGVSRSGKTPLSVYLAMYGWKVANVPLVKGISPPKELFEVDPNRVFGLFVNAANLISHRLKRLRNFNISEETDYVEEKSVNEEIRHAMLVFQRGNFTVINATNKPIESTANEILDLMAERFDYRGRKLKSPYKDPPEE